MTVRNFLEENGWIRSVIALVLVSTWVASVFTRIPLDDQAKTFLAMIIAFYFAKPQSAAAK